MKITRVMMNAMTALGREIKTRANSTLPQGIDHPGDFGCYWSDSAVSPSGRGTGAWVYPKMVTMDMNIEEFATKFGASYHAGANSSVLVFPTGVVKWARSAPLTWHHSTETDKAFFDSVSKNMPDLAVHLAKTTQRMGLFTVQEAIVPAEDAITVFSNDERIPLYTELMRVAFALGLRDVHMENWGWRRKKDGTIDFSTPVIFDVSKRARPNTPGYYNEYNFLFHWNDAEGSPQTYIKIMDRICDKVNTVRPARGRARKRNRKSVTPTGSIPSGWITLS